MTSLHAECACAICGSADWQSVLDILDTPVDTGFLYPTPLAARKARRADVRLQLCGGCGLIRNLAYSDSWLANDPGYCASLAHSPLYKQRQDRLISELAHHRPQRILDVGCGDGSFLRTLCATSRAAGTGIDPSLSGATDNPAPEDSIVWVARRFDDGLASELPAFDLVCCVSVLEDVVDPTAMLRRMRSVTQQGGLGYFEVFNGHRAVQDGSIWSFHFEQCNYYSASILARALSVAGWNVQTVEHPLQQTYIGIVARNDGSVQPAPSATAVEIRSAALGLGSRFKEQTAAWRGQLQAWRNREQRVVVWGVGGRAITFLNVCDREATVSAAVDINPDRQGKHVPGTGHAVVAPEELERLRPHVVVIMNNLYKDEILDALRSLGVSAEVCCADDELPHRT